VGTCGHQISNGLKGRTVHGAKKIVCLLKNFVLGRQSIICLILIDNPKILCLPIPKYRLFKTSCLKQPEKILLSFTPKVVHSNGIALKPQKPKHPLSPFLEQAPCFVLSF
jgi:hypothetical protein